ncbi:MAG: hypothetical protein WC584_02460 [Candidatus Pacearchaeota archaeon]
MEKNIFHKLSVPDEYLNPKKIREVINYVRTRGDVETIDYMIQKAIKQFPKEIEYLQRYWQERKTTFKFLQQQKLQMGVSRKEIIEIRYYNEIEKYAFANSINPETIKQNSSLIDKWYNKLQPYLINCNNEERVCMICEKIAKIAARKSETLSKRLPKIERILEGFVIKQLTQN